MSRARWGFALAASVVAHGALLAVVWRAVAPSPPPPIPAGSAAFDLISYPVAETRAAPVAAAGETLDETGAPSAQASGVSLPRGRAESVAPEPASLRPSRPDAPVMAGAAPPANPAEAVTGAATALRSGTGGAETLAAVDDPAPRLRSGSVEPASVAPSPPASGRLEAQPVTGSAPAQPVEAAPPETLDAVDEAAPRVGTAAFDTAALAAAQPPGPRAAAQSPAGLRVQGVAPEARPRLAVTPAGAAMDSVAERGAILRAGPAPQVPRLTAAGVASESTATVAAAGPRIADSRPPSSALTSAPGDGAVLEPVAESGATLTNVAADGETVLSDEPVAAPILTAARGRAAPLDPIAETPVPIPGTILASLTLPLAEAAGTPVVQAETVPSAPPMGAARPEPDTVTPTTASAQPVVTQPPDADAASGPPPAGLAGAAPSVAPDGEPAPSAAPETQSAAAAPPGALAQDIELRAPQPERQSAALAWSGEAGVAVDPVSLAAIQSFARAGDPPAGGAPVRDRIGGLLAAVPCARLQTEFNAETGQLTLRGHIPEEGLRAPLRDALRGQIGAAIPLRDAVLVLPRPVCGALSAIADVGLAQSDDLDNDPRVIGQRPQTEVRRFAEGERLRFDLVAPDYPAFYYIDFFDAAGNVLHLQPSVAVPLRRVAPGAIERVGSSADGETAVELYASPPFGQEILAAFAASVPLYDGVRPQVEAADVYLDFLRARVAEARRETPDFKGEWFYIFVQTGPDAPAAPVE